VGGAFRSKDAILFCAFPAVLEVSPSMNAFVLSYPRRFGLYDLEERYPFDTPYEVASVPLKFWRTSSEILQSQNWWYHPFAALKILSIATMIRDVISFSPMCTELLDFL
jgi:hypothetical protein